MAIDSAIPAGSSSQSDIMLRRFLGGMSIFTLVMTVPQVWTIWIERQAAGVSILSWGAYLLSAVLWFWFGLKQGDKNIYLPCIGWMVLNGAVVVGAIVYG
jgi:uncharacterized protein with PQ loop repeat